MVSDIFLDSYNQVDPSTRVKMEEMLWTWRDGGQNGRELFGIGPQESIERAILPINSRHLTPSRLPIAESPQEGQTITKGQVLIDLEVTLNQQERRLQLNAYDSNIRQNIEVLKQLRNVVQTSHIKQHELVAIDSQLRQMNRDLPPPPPVIPQPPTYRSSVPINQPIYNALAQSVLPSADTVASHSGISVDYPVLNYAFSQPATNQSTPPANSLSFAQPPQSTNSTSGRSSSVTTRSTDIANLFNSLVQAGIVPPPSATNAISNSAKNEESKDVQPHEEMEYEHNLLSINITLTSSDVAKSRTGIISYLYERMPVQCKQCAIRFPDGSVGKKRMEDHLDMHFRQNRKASENIGRGHSRSWFVGIKDWTSDSSSALKGKGRADAKLSAEAEAEEAKLRASYVVVPPGDEAKSVQCPICKETLKCEFLEDDEDWAWKNAIRFQGRIYHATCHAETATATSLASRLRHEAAAEHSRSGTPELSGNRNTSTGVLNYQLKRSPSPSSWARAKRKAEDTDDIKSEYSETPPLKKQSISLSK